MATKDFERSRRCSSMQSPGACVYVSVMLSLSLPIACYSTSALQQPSLLLLLPPPVVSTHCAKTATQRLAIDTARPLLLRVAQGNERPVCRELLGMSRRVHSWRVHDLAPVRDAARGVVGQQVLGEVKELSSDLLVPGVAMIVTIPLATDASVVSQEEIEAGTCWISVNGIPLQASKGEVGSNFWGTKRWVDVSVRIPPEHLDDNGLGLLYPGDEVVITWVDEVEALAFKANFAAAAAREASASTDVQGRDADQPLPEPIQRLDSETELKLKAELDESFPTWTSAKDATNSSSLSEE